MNAFMLELARKAANGMLSYDAEGDFHLSEREADKFAALIIEEAMAAVSASGTALPADAIRQRFGFKGCSHEQVSN